MGGRDGRGGGREAPQRRAQCGTAAEGRFGGAGMATRDLRSLMAELDTEDVALAGQALALSQWHAVSASSGLSVWTLEL